MQPESALLSTKPLDPFCICVDVARPASPCHLLRVDNCAAPSTLCPTCKTITHIQCCRRSLQGQVALGGTLGLAKQPP